MSGHGFLLLKIATPSWICGEFMLDIWWIYGGQLDIYICTGWWFFATPLEKYEFVKWDDDIFNMEKYIPSGYLT